MFDHEVHRVLPARLTNGEFFSMLAHLTQELKLLLRHFEMLAKRFPTSLRKGYMHFCVCILCVEALLFHL